MTGRLFLFFLSVVIIIIQKIIKRHKISQQEVLALIVPLGKLIVMHYLEKNQLLLKNQPSLPSGANIANTSHSAVVLHA